MIFFPTYGGLDERVTAGWRGPRNEGGAQGEPP